MPFLERFSRFLKVKILVCKQNQLITLILIPYPLLSSYRKCLHFYHGCPAGHSPHKVKIAVCVCMYQILSVCYLTKSVTLTSRILLFRYSSLHFLLFLVTVITLHFDDISFSKFWNITYITYIAYVMRVCVFQKISTLPSLPTLPSFRGHRFLKILQHYLHYLHSEGTSFGKFCNFTYITYILRVLVFENFATLPTLPTLPTF